MKTFSQKLNAIVLMALALPGVAFAALPAGVDTALDAIETDVTALAALVAPVMLFVLGIVLVFKLIKRLVNKI